MHQVRRENIMREFKDHIYGMKLGDRIASGDKGTYGFDWIITRVPGGWIYTAETAMSPASVFVPWNNEFQLNY
jgi:hypothetical protein